MPDSNVSWISKKDGGNRSAETPRCLTAKAHRFRGHDTIPPPNASRVRNHKQSAVSTKSHRSCSQASGREWTTEDIHAPEVGAAFSPPRFVPPQPPREAGLRRETHDSTRPPPVASHRHRARTMPPDSLHLCALKMQTSFKNCLVESSKSPSPRKVGSAPRPPPRRADSAQETPFSTLQQHSYPLPQPFGRQKRHARPRRDWGGDSIARQHSRGPGLATRLHNALPELPVQRHLGAASHSLELHRVPGAGAWLVLGPKSLLFDWDADLTRTSLERPLRFPFLDQDTRCYVLDRL